MTRAIILAAGRGSRMGPLTDEQPKCFTVFHGRRLLDWQMTALRSAGISEIAIVRGYCANRFTEAVTYFENPRWSETNMVSSLTSARDWLRAHDCIVSYSDIFYSAETVRRLYSCEDALAISYDPNWLSLWQKRFDDPLKDAETFRLNSNGTLAEIGQRSDRIEVIEGQYMGLLKMTPQSWQTIEVLLKELGPRAEKLDMTSLLRLGLEHGWRIGTVPTVGPWGEIDSASDLLAYAGITVDDITN